MRFAIVEDEKMYRDTLIEYIKNAIKAMGVHLGTIDVFESGEEFLASFTHEKYNVIILDIFMGGLNGIDVAKRIREKDEDVMLVFCTSSNEFASESYDVNAKYYLQKPVSAESVYAMLKRLNLSELEQNARLRLPNGYRCLLRNVIYSEYSNHAVRFVIKDAPSQSVYMAHKDAESLLLVHNTFHAINKGTIVNFGMVKSLDNGEFTMQNGEVIPISRRRLKDITELYREYYFKKLEKEV